MEILRIPGVVGEGVGSEMMSNNVPVHCLTLACEDCSWYERTARCLYCTYSTIHVGTSTGRRVLIVCQLNVSMLTTGQGPFRALDSVRAVTEWDEARWSAVLKGYEYSYYSTTVCFLVNCTTISRSVLRVRLDWYPDVESPPSRTTPPLLS